MVVVVVVVVEEPVRVRGCRDAETQRPRGEGGRESVRSRPTAEETVVVMMVMGGELAMARLAMVMLSAAVRTKPNQTPDRRGRKMEKGS